MKKDCTFSLESAEYGNEDNPGALMTLKHRMMIRHGEMKSMNSTNHEPLEPPVHSERASESVHRQSQDSAGRWLLDSGATSHCGKEVSVCIPSGSHPP